MTASIAFCPIRKRFERIAEEGCGNSHPISRPLKPKIASLSAQQCPRRGNAIYRPPPCRRWNKLRLQPMRCCKAAPSIPVPRNATLAIGDGMGEEGQPRLAKSFAQTTIA